MCVTSVYEEKQNNFILFLYEIAERVLYKLYFRLTIYTTPSLLKFLKIFYLLLIKGY